MMPVTRAGSGVLRAVALTAIPVVAAIATFAISVAAGSSVPDAAGYTAFNTGASIGMAGLLAAATRQR